MVPVPAVQFLNVLPVTVLLGLVPAPSVLLKPVILVEPATVMLEKLLLVCTKVAPLDELPLVVVSVSVPPETLLLNVPTIELLEMVMLPVAGIEYECAINVTLPLVAAVRLVNVLFETVAEASAAVWLI